MQIPVSYKISFLRIQFVVAAIAGFFGLNWLSLVALLALLVSYYWGYCFCCKSKVAIWKQLLVAIVFMLIVAHWSYVDPGSANDILTQKELIKALIVSVFGLASLHLRQDVFSASYTGLAVGLGSFGALTTFMSYLTQEFGAAQGPIYNIYTGRIDAGHTFIGYSISASVLMLLLLKSNKVIFFSCVAIALGVHASIRQPIFTGVLGIVLPMLFPTSPKACPDRRTTARKYLGILALFVTVALLLLMFVAVHTGYAEYGIISKIKDIPTDGRFRIYSVGYLNLGRYLFTHDRFWIADMTQFLPVPRGFWWHSLLIDSAKSSGIFGFFAALAWIFTIFGLAIFFLRRSCVIQSLVCVILVLTMLTSIPVQLGGQELSGVLFLTYAALRLSCGALNDRDRLPSA